LESDEIKAAIRHGIRYMSPYARDEPTVGRYRGSEIGFCKRKIFFSRFFPIDRKPNLPMFQGSCFTEALPSIFKASESDLVGAAVEIPVESTHHTEQGRKFNVFGHCDGVLPNEAFEFKFSGVRLQSGDPLPYYYFSQANFYAVEQNKPLFHLVAVERIRKKEWEIGQHVKVISHEADHDAYGTLMQRVGEIHDAVCEGTPPDKDPIAKWECGYCDYKDWCKLYEGVDKIDAKPLIGNHDTMMDALTKGR
tara:strand:+ start:17505 stop:18254 length:750 start_codon:yes stop_codon:yes gene_type:complete